MAERNAFSDAIATADGARPFIVSARGARVTCGELHAAFAHFAGVFDALGIGGDTPVAILLPQGPAAIVAILATMSAAVAAPLNPALGATETLALLRRIRPGAVIADASLDPALRAAVGAQVPVVLLDAFPGTQLRVSQDFPAGAPAVAAPVTPDVTGLLLPTSGTCGEPKLVRLRQAQLQHAAALMAAVLALTPDDRNYCVLPCFHIHGLSTVLASALSGGVVIAGGAFSVDEFGRALRAHRPTWLSATPAHYRALLNGASREDEVYSGHALRFLRSASAPMPEALAAAVEQAFAVPLLQAYGMTEAAPQIASNGLDARDRRPGSVGRPVGVDVAIVPLHESDPAGAPGGEIVIRGANVIARYAEAAPAGDTPFRDGWFHTGDLGFVDSDGFLYVTGRLRDTLNCGGEKLSPQQIESVLLAHPAVRDAAVFGAPHATLGEIPHAAVVLKDGFLFGDGDDGIRASLRDALRLYCLSRLAPFKVPHAYHIVAAIPTNDSGKRQRRTLHAQLASAATAGRAPSAGAASAHDLERTVASAWMHVLGPGAYRSHDNFFLLGGDSLSAALASNALERELGVRLPANAFFLHPTLAQQASLLAQALRASAHAPSPPAGAGGEVATEQVLPLSAAQHRLWFLDRAGSGSQYNMGAVLWLRGALDTAALAAAVDALRQRHAALRTTISVLDGSPVQRIRPFTDAGMSRVDLPELPAERAAAAAIDVAKAFRNEPYALDRGPLFRARLIRVDSCKHLLALGAHHIVCDGWSMELLLRELQALYTQLCAGTPVTRLPPAPQLHEHLALAAQRNPGDPATRADSLQWWRRQLAEVDPILHLPGRDLSAADTTSAAGHLHFSIPPAVVQRLEAQARRAGATLFVQLLGALAILLHRYSRQQRFCIGTVAANRHGAAMEEVVGFLAVTLPLPVHVTGADTLDAVVARSIDTVSGAFAHADVEFADIVQACGSGRAGEVSPLFQVMFAFHNLPQRITGLASANSRDGGSHALAIERVGVDGEHAKFDLSLHLRPADDALQGVWQYRCDRIAARTIAGMNDDFATILQAMVDTPRLALADIPYAAGTLSRDRDGEDTPPLAGDPEPVMQWFSRQARAHAPRTAICAAGSHIDYATLLERVERLGAYLAERQIGPGNTVAILLPRDVSMLVAPLAVMATGATFLPLDCASPVARLRESIEAAGVDLVIANRRTRAAFTASPALAAHAQKLLCLDDSEAAIAQCPAPFALRAPLAGDPAYIIFTSGSTGKPKGVVISHGNLAHYLKAMSRELDISHTDSYLHTASCAFSASLRQLLLPLLNGARVVLADDREVGNVEALLALANRERATIVDLVPTLWRACIASLRLRPEAAGAAATVPVRLALSASEPLPHALAMSIAGVWPHARLINMYGQTETSGIVAMHKHWHAAERSAVVALGRAIAGHAIRVVDEYDRPVAGGVAGEICVAGPCVGGYLSVGPSRSEAVLEMAAPDTGAVQWLRTGDLGRWREDGALEFCGRLDTQIKLRGFRIEPGDIEAVACSHPCVTDAAVVVAGGDAQGRAPQLQLFYCVGDAADADVAALRDWLAQRLPSYMLPGRVRRLAALPRTLSGKLDRGALAGIARGEDASSVRPLHAAAGSDDADAIARTLQAIWREVLLCDAVDVHDNFFDLGGSSLLSIEIVSAAVDAGLQMTLHQVFRYQTIAELANVVRRCAPAARRGDSTGSAQRPLAASTQAIRSERYTCESLRAFSREALEKAGLSPEGARIVTEVQLESSLRGQATHNIGDIPRYARRLANGVLNAAPAIAVTDTSALSATVDGDNGPGQWIATLAMNRAIALASRSGAGIVGVRRSNHFGAAGHYAWLASRAGMVGLCFTNGPVVIAPSGGITPLFGNNPLAIGLPRSGGDPVVLDIAMAAATRGKIGLAVAEGQPLQPGWILDKLGVPTTRLEDLAAGLAVPIGGHKGYGLALAIEVLAGALTGAGYCADHSRDAAARPGGADIGHFFIAFDPALFVGRDVFESRVADIVMQAQSSALAPGSAEIVVPGQLEFRARARNLRHGVPLPASVARRLADYGERHCLNATIERAPPVDVDAPDYDGGKHNDNHNNPIRTSSDAR